MKNIYDVLHSLGPIEVNITENLINLLPGNVFVVNTQGYLLWGNQRILDTLNLKSLNDYIGKHIGYWDNYSWECCKAIIESGKEILGEESYQGRYYMTNRKPLFSINGGIVAILGTALDITEQKQAELAKQEFLMNMAHDIRTPLSGIIGLSSIQADDATNTQEQQYGKWIHDASEQLLELLNIVIEVTAAEHQIEHVKKERINLCEFSEELQALMQPSIVAKGLELQLKLANNLPIIITDRIKLKRLVLNLLSNAVKFTKNGKVSLEIDLISIKEDRAKIEIRVTDTGIGIRKDEINKIFDRFYRAYPSYQAEYTGYGVGLYLVKKTLELLGGKIKVSSQEGKGSCFSLEFTFPVSYETIEKSIPKPTFEASKLEKIKGPVLIAEDNALVSYAVKKLLIQFGYEVTAVTEGKAALDALQAQSFVWALLDIGLPDLSGTEVVQHYRQWELENNKPRLPIFALTAHAEDKAKRKFKEMGIDEVLHKPFTEKDIKTIKKIIKEIVSSSR
jgi:signal transduction histidine kinase/CheY-like chemotaxis protein